MSKHAYTKSLKQNIKWFVKRTIRRKNAVDASIKKYLKNVFNSGFVFERGLNIGCGYYTPFDIDIKRISPKLINADATLLVKLFRPFSGKKIVLTNENWKHYLMIIKPSALYCFHTFSFIQIDWENLIKFCSDKDIKLVFDWSIQSSVELSQGVNNYCVGENALYFFDTLIENNFQILDLSKDLEQTNREAITEGKRFIVTNFNI